MKIQRLQANGLVRHAEVLRNLTEVGNPSLARMMKQLERIQSNPLHPIFIAVKGGQEAGAITVLVEPKLTHGCGFVAHIEDVVVAKEFQGNGIGRQLLKYAIEWSRKRGCYKAILDCTVELSKKLYGPCGFKRNKKEIHMRLDFKS